MARVPKRASVAMTASWKERPRFVHGQRVSQSLFPSGTADFRLVRPSNHMRGPQWLRSGRIVLEEEGPRLRMEESTASVLLRPLIAMVLVVSDTASPLRADCNANLATCNNPGVLSVLETGNGSTLGGTCPSAPGLPCSTPRIQDVTSIANRSGL